MQGGAYLLNGREIIADTPEAQQALRSRTGKDITREGASKQTICYGILESHNTSGDMDKLKIRFDKLTSTTSPSWASSRPPGPQGLRDSPCPTCSPTATILCARWAAPSMRTITCSDFPAPRNMAESMCLRIRR